MHRDVDTRALARLSSLRNAGDVDREVEERLRTRTTDTGVLIFDGPMASKPAKVGDSSRRALPHGRCHFGLTLRCNMRMGSASSTLPSKGGVGMGHTGFVAKNVPRIIRLKKTIKIKLCCSWSF